MNYPLPYWYQFTVSGATLPDFYWNVKSQEERIKKICEDLWKLIQVYKLLVDAINDHEERIKILEEKVAALEQQISQILIRLGSLEESVENIDGRLTIVEQQLAELIEGLDDQILSVIKEYMSSQEFIDQITNLINSLTGNKMDKVPNAEEHHFAAFDDAGQVVDSGYDNTDFIPSVQSAVVDHIATWTDNGNVKDSGRSLSEFLMAVASATAGHFASLDANGGIQDSGKGPDDFQPKVNGATDGNVATFDANGMVQDSNKAISTAECNSSSGDGTIPTSLAVHKSIIKHLAAGTTMDNIPMSPGTYMLEGHAPWTITVDNLTYSTNMIHVEAIIQTQDKLIQRGWFYNPSNPTPVLMERTYDTTNMAWSNWQAVSHEYIEATDSTASSVSAANPNALVYVPEE